MERDLQYLEYILASVKEDAHLDFRIFLISDEALQSTEIMQMSWKICLKIPKGIKNNLMQGFSEFEDEKPNNPIYYPLIFSLCLMHAVIQNRKNYGTIGWNVPYNFSVQDLNTTIQNYNALFRQGNISLSTLKFTTEIHYAGKITDPYDLIVFRSILNFYISNDSLKTDFKFACLIT